MVATAASPSPPGSGISNSRGGNGFSSTASGGSTNVPQCDLTLCHVLRDCIIAVVFQIASFASGMQGACAKANGQLPQVTGWQDCNQETADALLRFIATLLTLSRALQKVAVDLDESLCQPLQGVIATVTAENKGRSQHLDRVGKRVQELTERRDRSQSLAHEAQQKLSAEASKGKSSSLGGLFKKKNPDKSKNMAAIQHNAMIEFAECSEELREEESAFLALKAETEARYKELDHQKFECLRKGIRSGEESIQSCLRNMLPELGIVCPPPASNMTSVNSATTAAIGEKSQMPSTQAQEPTAPEPTNAKNSGSSKTSLDKLMGEAVSQVVAAPSVKIESLATRSAHSVEADDRPSPTATAASRDTEVPSQCPISEFTNDTSESSSSADRSAKYAAALGHADLDIEEFSDTEQELLQSGLGWAPKALKASTTPGARRGKSLVFGSEGSLSSDYHINLSSSPGARPSQAAVKTSTPSPPKGQLASLAPQVSLGRSLSDGDPTRKQDPSAGSTGSLPLHSSRQHDPSVGSTGSLPLSTGSNNRQQDLSAGYPSAGSRTGSSGSTECSNSPQDGQRTGLPSTTSSISSHVPNQQVAPNLLEDSDQEEEFLPRLHSQKKTPVAQQEHRGAPLAERWDGGQESSATGAPLAERWDGGQESSATGAPLAPGRKDESDDEEELELFTGGVGAVSKSKQKPQPPQPSSDPLEHEARIDEQAVDSSDESSDEDHEPVVREIPARKSEEPTESVDDDPVGLMTLLPDDKDSNSDQPPVSGPEDIGTKISSKTTDPFSSPVTDSANPAHAFSSPSPPPGNTDEEKERSTGMFSLGASTPEAKSSLQSGRDETEDRPIGLFSLSASTPAVPLMLKRKEETPETPPDRKSQLAEARSKLERDLSDTEKRLVSARNQAMATDTGSAEETEWAWMEVQRLGEVKISIQERIEELAESLEEEEASEAASPSSPPKEKLPPMESPDITLDVSPLITENPQKSFEKYVRRLPQPLADGQDVEWAKLQARANEQILGGIIGKLECFWLVSTGRQASPETADGLVCFQFVQGFSNNFVRILHISVVGEEENVLSSKFTSAIFQVRRFLLETLPVDSIRAIVLTGEDEEGHIYLDSDIEAAFQRCLFKWFQLTQSVIRTKKKSKKNKVKKSSRFLVLHTPRTEKDPPAPKGGPERLSPLLMKDLQPGEEVVVKKGEAKFEGPPAEDAIASFSTF